MAGHMAGGVGGAAGVGADIPGSKATLQARLKRSLAEVKDYELYKEVMETAVCKLQAEMAKLVQDRDAARKEVRQALAQARRSRRGQGENARASADLRQKLKTMEEERVTLEAAIAAQANKHLHKNRTVTAKGRAAQEAAEILANELDEMREELDAARREQREAEELRQR